MNRTKNLIQFKNLDWEISQDGLEQKTYSVENRRIRLLRLRDTFKEENWCLNGHIGFVLNGEMKIDFNGITKKYNEGDGIWIDEGESSKHKVTIEKGKEIQLVLFESINNE